jgi:hypothetical protein
MHTQPGQRYSINAAAVFFRSNEHREPYGPYRIRLPCFITNGAVVAPLAGTAGSGTGGSISADIGKGCREFTYGLRIRIPSFGFAANRFRLSCTISCPQLPLVRSNGRKSTRTMHLGPFTVLAGACDPRVSGLPWARSSRSIATKFR